WSIQPDPLTFVNATCNGQENGAGTVLATHSKLQCDAADTGGATFDLSGNVKEGTQERVPNENPIRGGGYNNVQGGTACANAVSLADDTFACNNVGFRCCK